jgi:hypothetical protein
VSFISSFLSGKKESSTEKKTSNTGSDKQHSQSTEVSFLGEIIQDGKQLEITDLICLSIDNFNKGNISNCIRCLNTALDIKRSAKEEIAIRRNMFIALTSFLGLGTPNLRKRDFDFCYVMEHLNKNMDAIIGLYATNEHHFLSENDASFLRDCFDMAFSNYQSVMNGYMAYELDGFHMYENRLPKVWDITFKAEPKGTLCVNGTIYPQHILP